MNVALSHNSTPSCQLYQFLMHRPKEDLSLLLQYILKSRNDRQYDGKLIAAILLYYTINTELLRYGIDLDTSATELNVSGPTNKSSVSEGRGTNLSQWVFLWAKNKALGQRICIAAKSRYQTLNFAQ